MIQKVDGKNVAPSKDSSKRYKRRDQDLREKHNFHRVGKVGLERKDKLKFDCNSYIL